MLGVSDRNVPGDDWRFNVRRLPGGHLLSLYGNDGVHHLSGGHLPYRCCDFGRRPQRATALLGLPCRNLSN